MTYERASDGPMFKLEWYLGTIVAYRHAQARSESEDQSHLPVCAAWRCCHSYPRRHRRYSGGGKIRLDPAEYLIRASFGRYLIFQVHIPSLWESWLGVMYHNVSAGKSGPFSCSATQRLLEAPAFGTASSTSRSLAARGSVIEDAPTRRSTVRKESGLKPDLI